MKKFSKVFISLTMAIVILSINISAMPIGISDTIHSTLSMEVLLDEEIPVDVDYLLMNAAIIDSSEVISIADVNGLIDESLSRALDENKFCEVSKATITVMKSDALKRANAVMCTCDFVHSDTYNDGIRSQIMYFKDGTIKKTVSAISDGVTYVFVNSNNSTIKKYNGKQHMV